VKKLEHPCAFGRLLAHAHRLKKAIEILTGPIALLGG
jgi:hypothetical protein